jgi:hypothetical protein
MNSRLVIARYAINSMPELPISEEEYQALESASGLILRALFVEERFDLLVQNYSQLEKTLLSMSIDHMLGGQRDWDWYQTQLATANKDILNLLSAARGYIDYVKQACNELFGRKNPDAVAISGSFSLHYDSSFAYRVMEALRNYSQHCGFPVHKLNYMSNRETVGGRDTLRETLGVITEASFLGQDSKFNSKLLQEIVERGGSIDIKPLAREYFIALAKVQEMFRAALLLPALSWDRAVIDCIDRFRTTFPDDSSTTGLCILRIEESRRQRLLPLLAEPIDRRKSLSKQNSRITWSGERYASGVSLE